VDDFDEQVAGNLLFKTLGAEALHKVMSLATVRRYRKGETIIQEGDTGYEVYLLRQGQVAVRTLQGGVIIDLKELGPGSIFGEVAQVSGVRRPATVAPLGDVAVLEVPGPELVAELRKHPTASELLDHIVQRRAQDTIAKTFGED